MKRDEVTLFAMLMEIHRDSLFLVHSAGDINTSYDKLVALKTEFESIKNSLLSQAKVDTVTKYKLEGLAERHALQIRNFVSFFSFFRKVEDEEYFEAKKHFETVPSEKIDRHSFIDEWAAYLARKAARHLYAKLVIGTIALKSRDIDDDSKLTISVIHYEELGKPPSEKIIGSFVLRRLGWNEQITDSFLLVNRLGDPGINLNGSTTPSSRFKGAPGASLMWTYAAGERADFIQRLQPSIGINVSYLDFDPAQSFEVGIGAMLGFWKNKVFLTLGRNLHVVDNPSYFGIGFSFARIAEKWNASQSSNQTKP